MGGMGRERIHNMKHDFKFISKHSPQVKSAYSSELIVCLSVIIYTAPSTCKKQIPPDYLDLIEEFLVNFICSYWLYTDSVLCDF